MKRKLIIMEAQPYSERTEKLYSVLAKDAAEVIGADEIKDKLELCQNLRVYFGTEPTSSPSLGYLIPMMKIRDVISAGPDNTTMIIFLADVHAFLNKGPNMINRTLERTAYYEFIIKSMLKRLDIGEDSYEFTKGSDVQLDKVYMLNLFKFMTKVTVNQAKKAGSDVVKQDKDPALSSLVYPLMQALDESVLEADIQLGGIDQRKIFALSRTFTERIEGNKCAYIMNPLLQSLGKPGSKMSSSDLYGKIEFLDSKEVIAAKIKKAYCVEKETDINQSPCLALAKYIILPIVGKVGVYDNYEMLVHDWANGKVSAQELKEWVADGVDKVVEPIRSDIASNMSLYSMAYP